MIKLIPSKWTTSDLTIEDMNESDINEAQQLYSANFAGRELEGGHCDPSYVHNSFHNGILPADGLQVRFRIQTIRHKAADPLIGFISIYHGYPMPSSMYITFLCLDWDSERQGLGRQAIEQLLSLARRMEYQELRVNVSLQNWSELRFWTKAGFNQISGIFGDKAKLGETFANVELVGGL
ncbi:GNAT family N-acetyltransferase [Paenibacillus sp. NPDC058071]|uniref:GNAT family N-acetyltransferase n=1 Tax=Paenibacillus sp. NPDC058071 TaxID=3346326 RepID=UPI0036DA7664